jgi:hypothetical protein
MNEYIESKVDQDFQWAQTRAFLSKIMHIFNPSGEDLLPFQEAKLLVNPKAEVYTGLATVPVSSIVGSEGRYRDFNKHFLPRKEYLRQRWTSIDKTRYQDVILPPIRLYEMGGVYFVRDGNHRVSVARSTGQLEIDAEVVSLESKIRLQPGMSRETLKHAVVEYEKKEFYFETKYVQVTGVDDLDFSEPGRYDTTREHIAVHKYYLNQLESVEIELSSALLSWHENVFAPIILTIQEESLLRLFPGRTAADLYLFLVQHWDSLKHSLHRDIGIGDAARDFKRSLTRKENKKCILLLDTIRKVFKKM